MVPYPDENLHQAALGDQKLTPVGGPFVGKSEGIHWAMGTFGEGCETGYAGVLPAYTGKWPVGALTGAGVTTPATVGTTVIVGV